MGAEYTLECTNCGGLFHSEDGFPEPRYCFNCLVAFKVGMRKVVEYLLKHCNGVYPNKPGSLNIDDMMRLFAVQQEEWNTKLKEWGL